MSTASNLWSALLKVSACATMAIAVSSCAVETPPPAPVPTGFQLASTFDLALGLKGPFDAELVDQNLYICTGDLLSSTEARLFTIDISSLSKPVIRDNQSFSGLNFNNLVLDNDILLACGKGSNSGNLSLFWLGNAAKPQHLHTFSRITVGTANYTIGSYALSKNGNDVYVGEDNNFAGRFFRIELQRSTTTPPTFSASLVAVNDQLSGSYFYGAVFYSSTQAYVVDDEAINDYNTQTGLARVGTRKLPSSVNAMSVDKNRVIFLASADGKLTYFNPNTQLLGTYDVSALIPNIGSIDVNNYRIAIGGRSISDFAVYEITSDYKIVNQLTMDSGEIAPVQFVKLFRDGNLLVVGFYGGKIGLYQWN